MIDIQECIKSLTIFSKCEGDQTFQFEVLENDEGELELMMSVHIDSTRLSSDDIKQLLAMGWRWIDLHLVFARPLYIEDSA